MSPQGVVTRKKAYNGLGLNPIKGRKFCPGTQARSRDKLSSLPSGITETLSLGPVLVGAQLVEQKRNVIAHAQKPDLVFQ